MSDGGLGGPDGLLIYVFGNGFIPAPDVCSKLILTWVVQDLRESVVDPDQVDWISGLVSEAVKYALSLPQSPPEHWAGVARLTAISRVQRMHPDRHRTFMLFESSKHPEQPDALLGVVFNPDDNDLRRAEELRASGEV